MRWQDFIEPRCSITFLSMIRMAALGLMSCIPAAEINGATMSNATPVPQSNLPDLSKPHPFSVHDMVAMERVGDALPSPDGHWVVFTRRTWDPDANKTTTNLWLVSADGKTLRQLTSARHFADVSPRWSPDGGTVAFTSNRGGSQQIWLIRLDGGEARQLTKFPVDVGNIQWSPTGSHMAFSADVYPDAANLEETAKRDKERTDSPVKAMKFERLMIRHWDTWFEGKRNHIFVVPLKFTSDATHASPALARAGRDQSRQRHNDPTRPLDRPPGDWNLDGEPVDLMKGVDGDCPIKPFGGVEDYAWSPDGKEIAYTTQIGPDEAWSTDLNIYVVPVTGGDPRCITTDNRATDTGPVYSRDSSTIAYRAMARPGFESDRYRIKLYDRKSGKTRTLSDDWDRSPGALVWMPDSKTLIATAQEQAREKIFALDIASGKPRPLVSDHYNTGVAVLSPVAQPNGSTADTTAASRGTRASAGASVTRLVFLQDSLVAPAEIWACHTDGSNLVRLTEINDERVKLAQMSRPEEFFFKGALGERVQAWLLKPVGFQEGKKYPVAFIIHGGPQGAIEDHFHYRWNPQAFAGAGYGVIAVNFHGSTGFGQAFTDSISGDWGGKPFEDLMKGLDHALANYPWLDGDRVAALGASYGGWMINWINGHTDRFKCLVNHDGGFDELSNYFTTEELWFPEWEFKGTPWEQPELYEKFSPSRYIANWKTPTLVIHGAKDYRLVDAEGIATFTALQRRGIPSQLLYFPDENHWVLKPKNSILWHDTVLAWLERWLKN